MINFKTLSALTLLLAPLPALAAPASTPFEEPLEGFDVVKDAIDAKVAEALRPTGPVELGWSNKGVNFGALSVVPAGQAARLAVVEGGSDRSASLRGGDPVALIPAGWTRVGSQMLSDTAQPVAIHVFLPLNANLMMLMGTTARPQGLASCERPVSLTVYRKGPARDDASEALKLAVAVRTLRLLARTEVCDQTEELASGRYRARTFTPQGQPLGAFGDDTKLRVLKPASVLAELLTRD